MFIDGTTSVTTRYDWVCYLSISVIFRTGGRSVVLVVYVLTYVFVCGNFFVHANQITYSNTKTPQEKDIAKMNAVQWQNPDIQYWRMWFYMSHVSTSYTVRLGCAADCYPRWWTSRVLWKSKPECKPRAAHCNVSFWLQEAILSAEESLFHL